MNTVKGAPRTKTIDFSGKSKLRTGPKILTGPGSTSGIYNKEKEASFLSGLLLTITKILQNIGRTTRLHELDRYILTPDWKLI